MLKLAPRAIKMPSSPIRKLDTFADQAKQNGKKIYHLNIGQPDIETPIEARNAVKNNDIKVLSYTPSAGPKSLKKAWSEFYTNKKNVAVSENDIIVTTGASEAIDIALSCVCDFNEEVIIPEPFYANYFGFAFSANVQVKPISSKLENNFALPPISEFEKIITDKTRAILICNPNNPTGYLYSKDELLQLRDLALKHDLFLIFDEVYSDFAYDGVFSSILEIPNIEQHAILIDSTSKRYSMCGARLGVLVSKNQELLKLALKFAQTRLSTPQYSQVASEAALALPSDFYKKINNIYKARRDALLEGLKSIPNINFSFPSGAFYTIVELPVDSAEKFAEWLLTDFEYQNETIMVAPASGFYTNHEYGVKQIRLAYILNEKDLARSMFLLKLALEKYNK